MSKFTFIEKFFGYENKREETNQRPGVMISGSQNVVSTDGDTIAIRQGYSVVGTESSTLAGILGSIDWEKLRSETISLRSYTDPATSNGVLQFYWSTALGGDGSWKTISSSLNRGRIEFFPWYDGSTENDDSLLFVDGTSSIHRWSGGIATFASATATTITIQGSSSTEEKGFFTAGTRQLIVDGTTYTYTGQTGTQFTGVTPDPTLAGHAAGELIVQAIRSSSNTPASGFTNDLIAVLDNQVFVASTTDRLVYVSANNDFTDFTKSSPRLPGEGEVLTFDAPIVGFDIGFEAETGVPKFMNVTAAKDFWYRVNFELSSDLTNETLTIIPLKSSTQQGAIVQSAIGKMKNFTAFITNEPTLDFLGRIENINTPQSKPISDPIKTDFDGYDFTNAHIKYFRNNLYITVPNESLLLVYNIEKGFWESPWTMPAGRLAIIGGDLHLHSNATPSTYKLFDTYSDNGNPISAKARMSYMNYGDRVNFKDHTETFVEGRITENTLLTRKLLYEYDGSVSTDTEEIDGSDPKTTFGLSEDGSLGKDSLGKSKLGGSGETDLLKKFRIIHSQQKVPFFEQSVALLLLLSRS